MGACDFEVVVSAKDAPKAFRLAVDDACYMYGHGGYTGTIAEKHEFVLLDPARVAAELLPLYEGLLPDWTVAAQTKLERELKAARKARAGWDAVTSLECRLLYVPPEMTLAEVCKKKRQRVRKTVAHLRQKGRNRALAVAEGCARFDIGGYRDKWGPALGVPLTTRKKGPNEYLFFGLASS